MIKDKGIVVNKVNYKENSLIVKIFTYTLGLKPYVIDNGKKNNPSTFELANMIEFISDNKKNNTFGYIKESTVFFNNRDQYDIKKQLVLTVVADIINRTLPEGLYDQNIFNFIWDALSYLHVNTLNSNIFLTNFMIKLLRHLGYNISSHNLTHTKCNITLMKKVVEYYKQYFPLMAKIKSIDTYISIFSI